MSLSITATNYSPTCKRNCITVFRDDIKLFTYDKVSKRNQKEYFLKHKGKHYKAVLALCQANNINEKEFRALLGE